MYGAVVGILSAMNPLLPSSMVKSMPARPVFKVRRSDPGAHTHIQPAQLDGEVDDSGVQPASAAPTSYALSQAGNEGNISTAAVMVAQLSSPSLRLDAQRNAQNSRPIRGNLRASEARAVAELPSAPHHEAEVLLTSPLPSPDASVAAASPEPSPDPPTPAPTRYKGSFTSFGREPVPPPPPGAEANQAPTAVSTTPWPGAPSAPAPTPAPTSAPVTPPPTLAPTLAPTEAPTLAPTLPPTPLPTGGAGTTVRHLALRSPPPLTP